jgi:deoxycytidylate deaminase
VAKKPTLYIGFTCAAGTDLSEAKQQLGAQLSIVGYECRQIKVSSAIADAMELEKIDDYYERTKNLMDAGDEIRSASENGSGVASLIVTAIRLEKEVETEKPVAYIIDSLKNPKEHEALDLLYGRNFYSISVYSSSSQRCDFIANKIAVSKRQPFGETHRELAKELMDRDQKGKKSTGQGVQETFPKSDFFLDFDDVESSIKRFVRLVFQDPFITPTVDEYMMFVAKATSLRSCDLSRQVGAVISSRSGAMISTGCNEVPYPGGGFFYEGMKGAIGDNRDKEEGHDPNFNEVKKSISEFILVLKSTGSVQADVDADELAHELLHGEFKDSMSEVRLRNLIEFSRVVHAEMHALTQAAELGRSVKNGVLYCTTYPCHLCARHIISSGIDQVVYIEPYPKSMTDMLYHREIISEHVGASMVEDGAKVVFRSFRGVSPILYQRAFSYKKRKDGFGTITEWHPDVAYPIGASQDSDGDDRELFVANQIASVMEKIHSQRSTGNEGEKADPA